MTSSRAVPRDACDQRLKARYRGMAWTWLLGQFITAYLKNNPSRKDLGWVFIRPFNSHLRHGCLGGVAELFRPA